MRDMSDSVTNWSQSPKTRSARHLVQCIGHTILHNDTKLAIMPRSSKRSSPANSRTSSKSKSSSGKAPSKSVTPRPSSSKDSNQVNSSSEETMPCKSNHQTSERLAKGNRSANSQAKKQLFAPLAEVLHCKAIVFAYLPYDTLYNLTPLSWVKDNESVAQADWVRATALLKALITGTIQEDGKADKTLHQVQNPGITFAHDLLVDLIADTSRVHPPMILMRQVDPQKYPNVWCYPAGTHACVDDDTSADDPSSKDIAKLSILVNRQTGYQMSRSDWEHYEYLEDTAERLGIHASLLTPNTPVHENVYIKEVIAPVPTNPTPSHSPTHTAPCSEHEESVRHEYYVLDRRRRL